MNPATDNSSSKQRCSRPPRRRTLVLFSQVFVPDPASVGQHLADVAIAMRRRGIDVCVYCSNRGYDNPKMRFADIELLEGVRIRRLPFSSFGKRSLLTRGLGMITFMLQVICIGLFKENISGILFSTSPPLIGFAVSVIRMFRRIPACYWAMDLNPDQLIALEKFQEKHPVIRTLESVNRMILRNADLIITLDRFMADRLRLRGRLEHKLLIIPPWPHETFIEPVAHHENRFRQRHELGDSFVVMYSGNHSPSNPLRTLLEAAKHFQHEPRLRFLFVGGGIGKKEVEQFIAEHQLKYAIALPYQPLAELRYSLSAADVHVVSLGAKMAGIIHPCKVYGAMAVGRPILYFGPAPSHIADLLEKHRIGEGISHGDVAGAVAALQRLLEQPGDELAKMGAIAQNVLQTELSQDLLSGRFCDALESILR